MTAQTNYDVIFAGAGIMGCAIAYNLLKRDPNLNILIVERDSTYEKASTTLSDGNTRIQFNLEPNIRMSMYGLEVLETFEEEFASAKYTPQVNFRRQGNMYLVDAAGEEYARKGYDLQKSLGCAIEWLEKDDIQKYYPLYEPHDSIVAATFGPNDGSMSPRDVLFGYRYKAQEMGATFLEASVEELLKEGDQMTGLKTADGTVYNANVVVNVTGAWAAKLAKTVGIDLPVTPIKREVYSVLSDKAFDELLPMFLLPTGQFIFHEGENNYMTGGKHELDPITHDDFSWHRERFENDMWAGLVDYIPSFDRLKINSGWGALYAVNTFDGNAILGEWPTVKGYFCANGFSGHGFQQGHAVGRYVAECILGVEHALDLSLFSPQRILDNTPVFENPARLI